MMSLNEPHIDLDLLEKTVVETAIPAHMMFLAAQAVITEGYVLRADVAKSLNGATAAPFQALMAFPDRTKQAAARVDAVVSSMLNRLNPDKTVHALYVSAMLAVVLVDEGLFVDVDNVAVLTGMVLLEDLKIEGGVGDYAFKENLLRQDAVHLLYHLQKENLYDVVFSAGAVTGG